MENLLIVIKIVMTITGVFAIGCELWASFNLRNLLTLSEQ